MSVEAAGGPFLSSKPSAPLRHRGPRRARQGPLLGQLRCCCESGREGQRDVPDAAPARAPRSFWKVRNCSGRASSWGGRVRAQDHGQQTRGGSGGVPGARGAGAGAGPGGVVVAAVSAPRPAACETRRGSRQRAGRPRA